MCLAGILQFLKERHLPFQYWEEVILEILKTWEEF